jgi:hypothetical protein
MIGNKNRVIVIRGTLKMEIRKIKKMEITKKVR